MLAAGKGTRLRSETAKVLHPVAGRTVLAWVLEALRPLGLDRVVVVVGHQAATVTAEAERVGLDGLVAVEQTEQRGTGHAVRTVVEAGALRGVDTVMVVPGDTPVITTEALQRLLDRHRHAPGHPAATLVTTELDDPTGYGRILRDDDGRVVGMVEERDATDEQRRLQEVGTSVYAFAGAPLAAAVVRLSTDNAQGEEYLTDVVGLLASEGVDAVHAAPDVVAGVNDRVQLAEAAAVLRRRVLERLMRDGVTVVDPATTYVGGDVVVERDATLLPGTHLEGATRIASGAAVGPDSRLVDATVEAGATVTYSVVLEAVVGPDATVGPFTFLRPGTVLDAGAKAGAYVEMKNAHIGEGSKVPHLSYVGDAEVGRDSNLGAATVTVNYDGYTKHRTVVGDRVHIGSDTMLVAPVTVGDDAYTGAGSVITKDVPPGALAVERTEQRIVEGYAARRRARHEAGPTASH